MGEKMSLKEKVKLITEMNHIFNWNSRKKM